MAIKCKKAKDLKGKEFCKWHTFYRHSTNNYPVFRNVIQECIDKGLLKFVDKPMGVDCNLFLEVSSNMVTLDLSKLIGPRKEVEVEKSSNV